jgi:two-component system chemotaxis sensor kinase CheA
VSESPPEDLDLETLGLFVEESQEALARVEATLLAAEGGTVDAGALQSWFRDFHTIKGTSGFLGFKRMLSVAHAAEDLLARLREGSLAARPDHFACLLEVVDLLRGLLEDVRTKHVERDVDVDALVGRLRAMAEGAAAAPAPLPSSLPAAPSPQPVAVQASTPTATPEPLTAPPAPNSPPARAPDEPARAPDEHAARGDAAEGTVRVPVGLLDKLMNQVGELVLARNQIVRAFGGGAPHGAPAQLATQRLHEVTTELQDSVMRTRLQPVGRVFEKIPRMVRDLCNTTGKQVEVTVHGTETGIDKALVEAIRDPVLHIVRNSVDHGVETPELRAASGKSRVGRLTVRAAHEGGVVVIEIEDDGAGIDPERLKTKAIKTGLISAAEAERLTDKQAVDLIFRPGFSTAEQVTRISGRGVGMDVVRTHVERANGRVEIDSTPGAGTIVRLKMPLTLAIVPALMVRVGAQRFAVPQTNLVELLYLDGDPARPTLELLRGAPVVRLRGEIVPIVRLDQVLELAPSDAPLPSPASIALVAVGARRFGILIDEIQDTEEIVVKGLTGVLKSIGCFGGATVLGDGSVALILDLAGLATVSGIDLTFQQPEASTKIARRGLGPQPHLVLTMGAGQQCAISLSAVARLEQVRAASLEVVAGREVVQYREGIMPVLRVEAVLPIGAAVANDDVQQLVVLDFGQPVGIAASAIIDIVDLAVADDPARGRIPFVQGEAVVFGRTTLLLDVYAIVRQLAPHIASEQPRRTGPRPRVMLVDDSNAMRASIGGFLRAQGLEVLEMPTGQAAMSQLRTSAPGTFHAVVTDLEMAGMDGYGLMEAVRRERPGLPIIAWTYHEDAAIAERVKRLGAFAFVNKLRREELVDALQRTGLPLPVDGSPVAGGVS